MIRHIVLTKFKPDVSSVVIDRIYTGLASLVDDLPGAADFTGGISQSPEQLERGFKHGFVIDFDSWEALQNYADHPRHRALGGQLVENAVGGIDGILVVDLDLASVA
ncbi:Dabb family protein [Algirhabdus cladophorae]|uniref:Dabb family protein n=1 Tax=Algirhabdus cladophorae TaxID=3377108 RepID=UPI003B847FED